MSNEPTIYRSIVRIDESTIAGLTSCGVATLVEALGPVAGPQQTMAEVIARRSTRATVGGQAITVATGLADNLMMHAALRVAHPGDLLVISCVGSPGAQWGAMVTHGARARGLVAVVTDGAVRDIDEIETLGFPVWAAHVSPLGARKDVLGWVNRPVNCGGVGVVPGDVIVADGDGVVVIPRAVAAVVLTTARARVAREETTREATVAGQLPGDLSGLYARLDSSAIRVSDEPWEES